LEEEATASFLFMGLFSETKTFVAASTSLLITKTPNIKKAGVLTSVLQGRDLAPDLVDSYLQGIFMASKRYYKYGRDSYIYGLPDGDQGLVNVQNYKIQPIIEAEVGFPILILASILDTCDSNYFAYPYMRDNRGWNPDDNTTTYIPEGSIGVVSFAGSQFVDVGKIEILYIDETQQNFYETITVTGSNQNKLFYHVTYVKASDTAGTRYYWNYDTSTNQYPQLTPKSDRALNSPYYPIVPVRENNNTLAVTGAPVFDSGGVQTKPPTALWASANSLLNTLELNYKNLGESVNKNPGIKHVDHAYVILGVDILTQSQPGMEYLSKYFTYLFGLNPSSKATFDHSLALAEEVTAPPKATIITIKDANYHIEIGYTWITNDVKTGSIGKRNFSTSTVVKKSPYKRTGFSYERTEITFRRQITDTTYSETVVAGLTHTNHVYKSYTIDSTVDSAGAKGSDGKRTDKNFVVPLNYAITLNMQLPVANDLMYESLWMVFNSYEVVELKWYETSFFQFVIVVAGIAISIITYTPGGFTQALLGISVSGAGLVPALLIDLTLSYALQAGFTIIAEQLGPEFALLAGLALGLYSMSTLINSPALSGLPFADAALFMSNGLQESAMEVGMEKITVEAKIEQDRQTGLIKGLEDKYAKIEMKVQVDPLALIQEMGSNFHYQSVQNYYHQKIHAGNIGINVLDSAANYVGNSLALPTTSNALGVRINV
jgi:hypothetical protein